MTIESFTAYFVILFIATVTPGPTSLLAINHGLNHGVSRTVYSGLGNLLGNILMALVSMLGLGAILLASGFIFSVIKWTGILYLIYIGVKSIIGSFQENANNEKNVKATINKRNDRLFLDGFIIAVGNPKGILFFTALFPQFINIKSATTNGFLIIFSTLAIVAFGCYMLYALFGVKLSRLFQIQQFKRWFNRVTGSIFIGTGLALVFTKK
ncbi:MAG TPA: LysE family translocator [Bacteroidales bacterium]|nr:LysE family translocator [Bacteroidales bacterium]